MGQPGGAATDVFPQEEQPRRSRLPSLAMVALVITIGLVITTGFYNNAVAPPSTTKRFAELIPLGEGSSASAASRIEIQGARPVVGSHFLLDPDPKLILPLSGGSPVPLDASEIAEAVADGDNFAWVERAAPVIVKYYDQLRGTTQTVEVPAGREPLDGTLRAGGGTVAWSFLRQDGTVAVAAFRLGNNSTTSYGSALAENRTLLAALGSDLFYSKKEDRSDVWGFNTTREREELLAAAPGVGRLATGAFFVAWVNESGARVEYYDLLDRQVRHVPPPASVTPKWVLANGLTILFGGTKQGLLFSSPRVEFYDFGTGNSHIYESIGLDFASSPYFAYADRTVVSLVVELQKRPTAPFTVPLLLATAAATAVTGLLAAREVMRPGRDL